MAGSLAAALATPASACFLQGNLGLLHREIGGVLVAKGGCGMILNRCCSLR